MSAAQPARRRRLGASLPLDGEAYFVLGDNLPDSEDSRYWGPVKRSWLIGLISVGG